MKESFDPQVENHCPRLSEQAQPCENRLQVQDNRQPHSHTFRMSLRVSILLLHSCIGWVCSANSWRPW